MAEGLDVRIRDDALIRLRAALARDDLTGVVIFNAGPGRERAGAA
ncbi:MAG: hypothetical protein ACJ72W_07800 [Actinoallomurus sp.]